MLGGGDNGDLGRVGITSGISRGSGREARAKKLRGSQELSPTENFRSSCGCTHILEFGDLYEYHINFEG
jgi:hypothetical protein